MTRRSFIALIAALLTVSIANADDGMPDAVRKSLNDGLIGEWKVEFTRGDVVSKGTYIAKWSAGKHSIRIDLTETVEDGTTRASELMGWDSDAKCLMVYGFGDKSNWTIQFTDVASRKWKGIWKGFFNGKSDGSSCTMEMRGDSFEYRDTTDGKPLVVKATRT